MAVIRDHGACCAECGQWAETPEMVVHAETCSHGEEQARFFHDLAHELLSLRAKDLRQRLRNYR